MRNESRSSWEFMRENVIAATKGHIVHFFLTGKERKGSVRQFEKRWREGETAETEGEKGRGRTEKDW